MGKERGAARSKLKEPDTWGFKRVKGAAQMERQKKERRGKEGRRRGTGRKRGIGKQGSLLIFIRNEQGCSVVNHTEW